MTGGQYLDLVNSHRGAADAATAGRIACYKSARYTVERPLQLGAAVAGRDDESFLSGYALALGEAFQLRDDLLGVFGDPSVTGKPAGEDIREGKQTLLLVLGGKWPAGRSAGSWRPRRATRPRPTGTSPRCARRWPAAGRAMPWNTGSGLADRAQAALGTEATVPAEARAALLGLAARATWRGR